jgi:hypothetical protein
MVLVFLVLKNQAALHGLIRKNPVAYLQLLQEQVVPQVHVSQVHTSHVQLPDALATDAVTRLNFTFAFIIIGV